MWKPIWKLGSGVFAGLPGANLGVERRRTRTGLNLATFLPTLLGVRNAEGPLFHGPRLGGILEAVEIQAEHLVIEFAHARHFEEFLGEPEGLLFAPRDEG